MIKIVEKNNSCLLNDKYLNDYINGISFNFNINEARKHFNKNYDAKNVYGPPSLNDKGEDLMEEIMGENMKLFAERKRLSDKLETLLRNSEIIELSKQLANNISKSRRMNIIEDISYEKVNDHRGIFQKEGEEQLQKEMLNIKSIIKSICLNNVLDIPILDESFRSNDENFEKEYCRKYL